MTDNEIRTFLERLTLTGGFDNTAPAGFRAFACYVELPGCMALGPDQGAAVRELGQLIVPFIKLIVDAGGDLPVPARERVTTEHLSVGPFFVGDPKELLGDLQEGVAIAPHSQTSTVRPDLLAVA